MRRTWPPPPRYSPCHYRIPYLPAGAPKGGSSAHASPCSTARALPGVLSRERPSRPLRHCGAFSEQPGVVVQRIGESRRVGTHFLKGQRPFVQRLGILPQLERVGLQRPSLYRRLIGIGWVAAFGRATVLLCRSTLKLLTHSVSCAGSDAARRSRGTCVGAQVGPRTASQPRFGREPVTWLMALRMPHLLHTKDTAM